MNLRNSIAFIVGLLIPFLIAGVGMTPSTGTHDHSSGNQGGSTLNPTSLTINTPTGGIGASPLTAKHAANGDNGILSQRFTDAGPLGRLFTGLDAANSTVLFGIGIDGIMTTASVGTVGLRTATGSATSVCSAGGQIFTGNDYAFDASITHQCTLAAVPVVQFVQAQDVADPVTTVTRFTLAGTGSSDAGNRTIRWRYVTASDQPRIWVVSHMSSGVIEAVWTSDDPCTSDDQTPCIQFVSMIGKRVTRYQAADLSAVHFPVSLQTQTRALMPLRQQAPVHEFYRFLQRKTGDSAPSAWILVNLRVNPVSQQLECKVIGC